MELQLILETITLGLEVIYASCCLLSDKYFQKPIVLWIRFREINFPPQNQHQFIARAWTREIVGTASELQVVLQMATPLKKLLVLAMVTAYFLSESSTGFFIQFFHCGAKVCSHDYLVVNVSHFANEGCNELEFLGRDRSSATESHRFIARVWACEIVRVSNELKVVLQKIATPLQKLLFRARLTACFLFRVEHGFFNPISYFAKVCK